ncbi:MAG TPA: ATP-binding protein [Anaerolineae bacterium]|nr:ATP-binding protein [Anaerolineae bacterium]
MNRLSVRLTLAILATTLLAVGVVALLANRATGSEFRRYLAAGQLASAQNLAPELVAYYAAQGSWDGVAAQLDGAVGASGRGRGAGAMAGRGGMWTLQLADGAGQVLYDSAGGALGATLSRDERETAMPIVVDGATVGYLLALTPGSAQLAGAEQAFLDRINQALLVGAAFALLLGVLVGVVLARTLAAPLGQVSAAAGAIAAGDLSQRVPERGTVETQALARSFNQMAGNLEQAEQLRRNLLADVAHELRTPLTVIQGNLQALLDGVYPLERAEIATIYDETRLLSRLVADLRELAQAEAGQLKLHLGPVDVAAVLAQTVDSFALLAQQEQVSLHLDLSVDLPPTLADSDRLAQVLRNLLANAIRHAAPGGHVQVTVRPDQGRLRFSVADDGPGIPAADLPHVFDRFWRGDPARSRDSGGSGLGLAITRHLVEAQGGVIGVESHEGRGTEFWFTLGEGK